MQKLSATDLAVQIRQHQNFMAEHGLGYITPVQALAQLKGQAHAATSPPEEADAEPSGPRIDAAALASQLQEFQRLAFEHDGRRINPAQALAALKGPSPTGYVSASQAIAILKGNSAGARPTSHVQPAPSTRPMPLMTAALKTTTRPSDDELTVTAQARLKAAIGQGLGIWWAGAPGT